MAGGWEFPGGKVESGEQPLQALARELREELGIEIGPGPHRPVRRIRHSYPDRDVMLDVWLVRDYAGTPHGLDGQALRWCESDQLGQASLLPADQPIVAALRLPAILIAESTDDYSVGVCQAHKQLGVMCNDSAVALTAQKRGADFVLMSADMPMPELSRLCSALSIPVFAAGMPLDGAWKLGASGIHMLERKPGDKQPTIWAAM